MRVGATRTSLRLEPEFWDYLQEVARARESRLSALVSEVADATPGRANLASTLRVFALRHARQAARSPAPGKADEARMPAATATP